MRELRPLGRTSSWLFLSSIVCLALSGACGRLKPAATDDGGSAGTGTAGAGTGGGGAGGAVGGRTLVTVSGTAAPHPLDALLGGAVDFSMLKIAIVDPTAVITNPNADPLAAATLDTSATNCTATAGCSFSLVGVDITNQTLGLVGTLEDTRSGDARLFVKTGTGMGTAAFLDSVRKSKAPITNRQAFVVTRALEAKLALYVSAVLGQTFAAGDLEARGFLIGHVVGRLSDLPQPAGVAGATVAAQGSFDVIYPDATFTGKGTATSSSGIFLMVPKLVNGAAQSVVTSWSVVPPSGDSRTWEMHLAGSNPGNAFVIIMPADELPSDGGVDGATDATDAADAPSGDATPDGGTDAKVDAASDAATDAAVDTSDAHAG